MPPANPQLEDMDPMEIQDQEDAKAEGAELASVKDGDGDETDSNEQIEEEEELDKDIDAVVNDDSDDDADNEESDDSDDDEEEEEEKPKPTRATADDKPAKKKTGGYLIPKDLIDRALTPEDLFDEGSL